MSLHFLWLYKIPNKTKNAPRRPPTITNRVHVQFTIHSKQSNERTSSKTNIKNCSQQLCYVFRLVCNLDKTSGTDDSGDNYRVGNALGHKRLVVAVMVDSNDDDNSSDDAQQEENQLGDFPTNNT